MGFFRVTDIPARRVVQYSRAAGHAESVVYIEDESVLGKPLDSMPFADKTGIPTATAGMLYEVAYLPDAGDVYIDGHPEDGEVGDLLSVSARGGVEPYTFQWYFNGQMTIDLSTPDYALKAAKAGKYFCVVRDADGVEAVSKEAEVK